MSWGPAETGARGRRRSEDGRARCVDASSAPGSRQRCHGGGARQRRWHRRARPRAPSSEPEAVVAPSARRSGAPWKGRSAATSLRCGCTTTPMRTASAAPSPPRRSPPPGQTSSSGKGAYRPGSAEGRHTLAHELTHVVQQGDRRGRRAAPGRAAGRPDRRRDPQGPVGDLVRQEEAGPGDRSDTHGNGGLRHHARPGEGRARPVRGAPAHGQGRHHGSGDDGRHGPRSRGQGHRRQRAERPAPRAQAHRQAPRAVLAGDREAHSARRR